MKILGIDEAGRGPVIGPLVMCGYLIDEAKIQKLKELGVKDSKSLSTKKRYILRPILESIADDYIILKIKACDIDKLRTRTNLNKIEIERMQQIINSLEPDKVIIDAIERNTKNFREKILAGINKDIEVIAENFADKKYHVVSAASIIAKVYRDEEILALRKHGFNGSGYPSDPRTIEFLKKCLVEKNEFPDFVRKTWVTAQYIKEEREQSKLSRFIK